MKTASLINSLSNDAGKKVNIESQVDSNLLGGIKLRSENIIIDNSLKFRLNKIKESLIKS